jgi:hypothetical protein
MYGAVISGTQTVFMVKNDSVKPTDGNPGTIVYKSHYDGNKWTIPAAVSAVSSEHGGIVAERLQTNTTTQCWLPDKKGSITAANENTINRSHDGGVTWFMYNPALTGLNDVFADGKPMFQMVKADIYGSYLNWEREVMTCYRFRGSAPIITVPDSRGEEIQGDGQRYRSIKRPNDVYTAKFYDIDRYRGALVKENYTADTWDAMAAAYDAYKADKSEENYTELQRALSGLKYAVKPHLSAVNFYGKEYKLDPDARELHLSAAEIIKGETLTDGCVIKGYPSVDLNIGFSVEENGGSRKEIYKFSLYDGFRDVREIYTVTIT